ncbi:MAG: sugar phosphate isomerase/epimerase family protein [Planctomycetota bacterium]|jgi:sugar phosphate isomerase/epimerase
MIDKNKPISRRDFVRKTAGGALMALVSTAKCSFAQTEAPPLRLGGPVEAKDPETWIKVNERLGYRAAYCPVGAEAEDNLVKAYAHVAQKADIIIAEVGAWSNPISPDEEVRRKALARCREQLALADRIGACCCVNISGSRAKKWDGPHPDNLTEETFDLIVETTRSIIDYVKPKRTYFTLETMPWAYPDSPDSYVRLIKAIDRKGFAVHLDPVNLVNSPRRYFNNTELIRECFKKLGPYIKSCHAKDIVLEKKLTTHLNETQPGLGGLDYATFLRELSKLPDTPLMLEHLETQGEYRRAADYIRSVAGKIGLSVG